MQTHNYRREQDKTTQMTKQTNELDRLPVWPPNSPDLNLIEVVWYQVGIKIDQTCLLYTSDAADE